MSDERWYFCLVHQQVEREAGCAHAERLGPFSSQADAAAALEKAAERNEQWDSDPRWNDD